MMQNQLINTVVAWDWQLKMEQEKRDNLKGRPLAKLLFSGFKPVAGIGFFADIHAVTALFAGPEARHPSCRMPKADRMINRHFIATGK
jgi:hypothetical protein